MLLRIRRGVAMAEALQVMKVLPGSIACE